MNMTLWPAAAAESCMHACNDIDDACNDATMMQEGSRKTFVSKMAVPVPAGVFSLVVLFMALLHASHVVALNRKTSLSLNSVGGSS